MPFGYNFFDPGDSARRCASRHHLPLRQTGATGDEADALAGAQEFYLEDDDQAEY
jgi:hypothetical protein